MAADNYLLLLNENLKSHILSLHDKERTRLREKFDFLANGIWDTGVRVKKLKGLSGKVIFEARLTRGRRILFTLGKHEGKTAIYVWGISDHDHINDNAANILPHNAPFLNFEPESEEDYPDLYIDDLNADYFSQESIEERVKDDCGPQKWHVLSDEEWQRLLLKADPGNLEIFLFLTSKQSAILENKPPILLSGTAGSGKTTIAIYYLFKKEFAGKRRLFLTYNPFLKRFSERIYEGLVKNTNLVFSTRGASDAAQQSKERVVPLQKDPSLRPDFFTFQELLQEILQSYGQFSKRIAGLAEFEDIFSNHKLYRKYDSELVWEEIRSIIKGAKPAISLRRYKKLLTDYLKNELKQAEAFELKDYLLGLRRFEFILKIERVVAKRTKFASYGDFLLSLGPDPVPPETASVLQEILKIVDKRAGRFSTPLLTFNEYNSLGKKRAPNFIYSREDIYSIAEYYQQRLEQRGLEDEIDLCRKAISALKSANEKYKYDLVVCDEVQDFSDIQLSLILRLADPFLNILFAGDTKQIINPSGFRWEEVKAKFYERGVTVPDVSYLNLNFRCVGSIVKLANGLLDLKQHLIGLSGSELREEWKFNGKPPFLIHNVLEKEILKRISLAGAGRIILVREEQEQERLKKILNTELIFTIYQAKGLEFDTVLLWKFCHDKKSADIWRRIGSGYAFDRGHYPHLKHELSLLYVAITRSRNTLIIYDGESPSDIWSLEELYECLYRTEDEAVLAGMWERISTPEEWQKQGDYFFEREYYPAAVECYRNSGNLGFMERAQAFVLVGKKEFGRAALLFEKQKDFTLAAENFEKDGNYIQALKLWKKLNNKKRVFFCRIQLYEQQGDYNRAAEEWEKVKNFDKALKNWLKAENHTKIAGYYYSLKQYKEAAKHFELAHDYSKGALCYKKIKSLDRAADLFLRAGEFEKAVPIYKKLKDTKNLLKCYTRLGDFHSAALLYEKQMDVHKTIEYFKRFVDHSEANGKLLAEEAEKYDKGGRTALKAAVRYSALSLFEKSAPIYFKLMLFDQAIREFNKTGNIAGVAQCYSDMGEHYKAVVEMEKSGMAEKFLWVTEELEKYVGFRGSYSQDRADRLFDEAEGMMKEGAFNGALARWQAINYQEGIYQAFLRLCRDDEALEYLMDNFMEDFAIEYLEQRGDDLDISVELVKRLAVNISTEWYMENFFKELDVIARLFMVVLQKQKDEIPPLVEGFLSSIPIDYNSVKKMSDSVFGLILAVRSYNTICRIADSLRYRISTGEISERAGGFFEKVKKIGESEQDNTLLACYFFLFDSEKFEEYLNQLTMTDKNLELFSESSVHYRKAVEHLLAGERIGKRAVEKAVEICRMNEDFSRAAEIHERFGNLKAAGKNYREARHYKDALRCYREIGDRANMARVYERMKDFKKAVDIWGVIGRNRDVLRVKKKWHKAKHEDDDSTQIDLF